MPSKQYFTQSIGFSSLHNHRIILDISVSSEYSVSIWGNKSLFTWRVIVPPKVNLVRFEQYCIVLLSSFHIGSLHCIGSSNSRNEYTVSDHPSSRGPLNPWIHYQMRNNALPVIIGLQYIRDWPPGSKSVDQECWILKMPDIKNAR